MANTDNSILWFVVLPAIAGVVGFLVLGPIGFFSGLVLVLVVGANVKDVQERRQERIDELERRVEELEAKHDDA